MDPKYIVTVGCLQMDELSDYTWNMQKNISLVSLNNDFTTQLYLLM